MLWGRSLPGTKGSAGRQQPGEGAAKVGVLQAPWGPTPPGCSPETGPRRVQREGPRRSRPRPFSYLALRGACRSSPGRSQAARSRCRPERAARCQGRHPRKPLPDCSARGRKRGRGRGGCDGGWGAPGRAPRNPVFEPSLGLGAPHFGLTGPGSLEARLGSPCSSLLRAPFRPTAPVSLEARLGSPGPLLPPLCIPGRTFSVVCILSCSPR